MEKFFRYAYINTYTQLGHHILNVYISFQNCLVQIFDFNQVDVSKNQILNEVFFASMRSIFVHLDSRIGM